MSIIGIWPRFIEPRLIKTTKLSLKIPHFPASLAGMRIVQFSDLHFHQKISDRFLDKLSRKIAAQKPDIVVFTGDFLCFSRFVDPKRLKKFFQSIHAPHGCYAILGNHDYSRSITVNEEGYYAIRSQVHATIKDGFKRLLAPLRPRGEFKTDVDSITPHPQLIELLADTPFKLLENETVQVTLPGGEINLTGLGEYMARRCLTDHAFQNYDSHLPGVVLSHNPDSWKLLKRCPGDVILCGHTHGGQVNLPFFRDRFIVMEEPRLCYGLFHEEGKWLFVSRGVGSVMPFRWFAMPEIISLTLETE